MKHFTIAIAYCKEGQPDIPRSAKEYREDATSFPYAVKKAMSQYRKDIPRVRMPKLIISVIDLGTIPEPQYVMEPKELEIPGLAKYLPDLPQETAEEVTVTKERTQLKVTR